MRRPCARARSSERSNYVSEDDSPTLKVSGIPSDPNGDEVLVQYQVSDDPNDFTGNHLIWESAWTDERAYVVPSGILVDGQTYYWHARSWDIGIVGAAFATFVRWYEEPALRRRFGEEYEAYRRAVSAWWPRRRRWEPGELGRS